MIVMLNSNMRDMLTRIFLRYLQLKKEILFTFARYRDPLQRVSKTSRVACIFPFQTLILQLLDHPQRVKNHV